MSIFEFNELQLLD
ncbi:Protein of unknown function [Bacillus toyonensis]|nr:Protein of unknown function [Bacillus toyonensis]